MPTIVNDGISDALFAAIKNVQAAYHRTGYLSTTSCIDSPRIRVLEARHDSQIVINASTLVPSFIGSCVHAEIERGAMFLGPDYAAEKEFVTELLGIKFSGRPDMYQISKRKVGDEKTTSVFTYQKNPNGKKEHIAQVSINGWLIRQYGYACDSGWIELVFLDWKRSKAAFDSRYPRPVEVIQVPTLWSDEETKGYVLRRVALHLDADKLPDNELPRCTDDEKWQKPHVWAVFKKSNKSRALKLCDTQEEAYNLVGIQPRGTCYVEERPGERTRCEFYCHAKPFCNQYLEEGPCGK